MALPKRQYPSGPSKARPAATSPETGPYTSDRKPQLKKGNEPSNQLDANRGGGGPSTASSTGTRGTNDSPAVDHTMGAGMGGTAVYPVPHPMAYGVPFGYTVPNPYRHHGGNDTGNGNGNGGNGGDTHHQHTAPCLTPEVLSLHNRAWDHRYTPDIDRWAARAGIGRRLLMLPEAASVAAASVGHASTARGGGQQGGDRGGRADGDDADLDQWAPVYQPAHAAFELAGAGGHAEPADDVDERVREGWSQTIAEMLLQQQQYHQYQQQYHYQY